MTTPARNTVYRCITLAMKDAGLLQDGAVPSPDNLAEHMGRLFDLIMFWQTQGIKLWLHLDVPIPLTSGVSAYTLAPGGSVDMNKPFRVLQGYYLYGSTGVRRPVSVMSYNDWLLLSSTTQTGTISQYFVQKQATELIVNTWLTPDDDEVDNGELHVLVQAQPTPITQLNDTMEFPQEWFMALRWGLADDICAGQPQQVQQKCELRAHAYRTMLEDWDVEDAPTSFAADMRMGIEGRFR